MRRGRGVVPSFAMSSLLASSAVLGLCAAPVLAQVEPADEASPAQDRIVVTALKRAQDETQVPVSISAFDADALADTRARTLEGLEQLVPNFSFEGAGTFPNLTIRGVGQGGRNVGFSTRAGAYLDGVYVGQPPALPLPLLDVDRVEILRGPQGNLYGRNTVSGAVNVITKLPGSQFEARSQLTAGSHGLLEAQAYLGGPILPGLVFAGLSVGYEERDGFVDNIANGSKLDGLERTALRGVVSYDASEALSLTLRTDYSQTDTSNIVGETTEQALGSILPGAIPYTPLPTRTVNLDLDPSNDATVWGASLTGDYETETGWMFRSITAKRNSIQNRVNDLDYSPVDLSSLFYEDDFTQSSQEFQVISPDTDRVRFIAGLYFFYEEADSLREVPVGSYAALPIIPVAPGVTLPIQSPLILGTPAGASIVSDAEVVTNAAAVFGTVDVDVTDRWTVTAGLRSTVEEKDLTFNLDGSNSGAFSITSLSNFEDSVSDEEVTWSASSVFALTDDVNVFGRVATGFKSAGYNVDFVNAGQVALGLDYDPETVVSYEAGIKGYLADDRVRFDATVFLAEYENFQISQFIALGSSATVINLTNAGEVETTGFEASLAVSATDALSFGANYGMVDTEFTDFVTEVAFPGLSADQVVVADYTGNELPYAPGYSGAVFANYVWSIGGLGEVDLYGEYSFQDEAFSEAENEETVDARNLVNARVTFRPTSQPWSFSVWGNNVLDETYIETETEEFFRNRVVHYGAPATWGADVSVQF